ncbi:MAG: hypothetical protein A49_10670 [Methyloceanibacter sp.]|uniref:Uncharacterized protein n=1 Tax=Methyloceanibacter caenitepidi TaxID=1384459 RepID=A0A0A8K1A3_9HYPH|nr:hypothetical protein GL4_1242 [Methyloceanibacter caenitepidi]GFO81440.1 MAG: hypothetical protein A49_10670 [Methyloceanibacter sp.]
MVGGQIDAAVVVVVGMLSFVVVTFVSLIILVTFVLFMILVIVALMVIVILMPLMIVGRGIVRGLSMAFFGLLVVGMVMIVVMIRSACLSVLGGGAVFDRSCLFDRIAPRFVIVMIVIRVVLAGRGRREGI